MKPVRGEVLFITVKEGMEILNERDAAGVETSCRFYCRLMKKMNKTQNFRKTLDLFERMKATGVRPNEHSYTSVMHACSQLKEAKLAQNYFHELKEMGDLKMSHYSYTAVIDACVRSGAFQRGMLYFEEMLLSGLKPTQAVYGALISGCRFMNLEPERAAKKCTELLRDMQNRGVRPTVPVYGAAMTVYYAAGDVSNVMALYKLMKHHQRGIMDAGVYDVLFKLFSDGSQSMNYVVELYQEMLTFNIKPSFRTFALLMRCAMKAGDWQKAWVFYKELQEAGHYPNLVIYNCIIGAYVQAAKMQKHEANVYEETRKVVDLIEESNLKPDGFTYNQLMLLCLWLKDLNEGVRVFHEMQKKGIELKALTYTNLMKLYIQLGNPADGPLYLDPCFQIFREMEKKGMKLDSHVFASLFGACSRAKNGEMVNSLVLKMQNNNISFDAYLYNCIIRVWTAVGEQQRAMGLLTTMRQENVWPNVVTFTLLLESLVNRGNPIGEILDLIRLMQKYRVVPNDATRQTLQKLDMSKLRAAELAYIESFLQKS